MTPPKRNFYQGLDDFACEADLICYWSSDIRTVTALNARDEKSSWHYFFGEKNDHLVRDSDCLVKIYFLLRS